MTFCITYRLGAAYLSNSGLSFNQRDDISHEMPLTFQMTQGGIRDHGTKKSIQRDGAEMRKYGLSRS
jgi:hypothetical protein